MSACDDDPGGLCQYDPACSFYAENCRHTEKRDRLEADNARPELRGAAVTAPPGDSLETGTKAST